MYTAPSSTSIARRRAAVAALIAAGLLGAPAAASAATAAKSDDSASTPVVWKCDGDATSAPRQLVLACGDANEQLVGLRWSRWGQERATARGRVKVNDCKPNCARGRVRTYAVRVTASKLRNGEATRSYDVLSYRITSKPAAGIPRSATFRMTQDGPQAR